MRIYLIATIICFGFSSIFAQNYVDILRLNANTTSLNKFDTSASSTRVNEIGADFTLPIKINDSSSVITGLIYEQIQTRLFAYQPIETISSVCLKAGFNKTFNSKWSGMLLALPKIASDFKKIGNKDFQLGAIGIVKYKKNENLIYKFGLYYNSELFGPFFVPMFGLYYLSPNKKFETNLMLPLQADANYKLIKFLAVGVNFNGQIRSYHLNNIAPNYASTYLGKSSNELCAYLKFNITKSVIIQTRFGQTLGRTYRVYADNDKVTFGLPATYVGHKRQQLNTDFSGGQFFQFVFIYRFNL